MGEDIYLLAGKSNNILILMLNITPKRMINTVISTFMDYLFVLKILLFYVVTLPWCFYSIRFDCEQRPSIST